MEEEDLARHAVALDLKPQYELEVASISGLEAGAELILDRGDVRGCRSKGDTVIDIAQH